MKEEVLDNCRKGKDWCFWKEIMPHDLMENLILYNHILDKPPKEGYQEFLKDIEEDVCGMEGCLRREVAIRHYNLRELEQRRCTYDFKWTLSQAFNFDVGFEIATILWIKTGYAESFEDQWETKIRLSEKSKHGNLYVRILDKKIDIISPYELTEMVGPLSGDEDHKRKQLEDFVIKKWVHPEQTLCACA